MQLSRLGLLALALSSPAFAAIPKVVVSAAPDPAGPGSGSALTTAVKSTLSASGVPLASPTEVSKAAKLAKVKVSTSMPPSSAGKIATKGGFAGVILFRKAKGKAFGDLIDKHGQVMLERSVRFTGKKPNGDDVQALVSAVAEAIGAAPAVAAPPVTLPVGAPPVVPIEAAPTAAAPSPTEPAVPTAPKSAELEAAYAAPEQAALPPPPPPYNSYLFRASLGGGPTIRTFFNPQFTYSTGTPYPWQLVVAAELFPLKRIGLGLMIDGAWSASAARFAGQSASFTTHNYRADVDLAYRLVFTPTYAPTLWLRAGFGLRDFVWPSAAGVANTNRFFGEFGLTLSQPLVPRYLNLVVGGTYLPWANQSGVGQAAYGPSTAWGAEWLVGFGGDIAMGFEWQLQVDQERFFDRYTVPTVTTNPDIYTDYSLLLRFRLD
jgi:hypothetical protein